MSPDATGCANNSVSEFVAALWATRNALERRPVAQATKSSAAAILICRRLRRPYKPSASPQAQDDDAGVSGGGSSTSNSGPSRQSSGRLASSLGLVFFSGRQRRQCQLRLRHFPRVLFTRSDVIILLSLSSPTSPTTTDIHASSASSLSSSAPSHMIIERKIVV